MIFRTFEQDWLYFQNFLLTGILIFPIIICTFYSFSWKEILVSAHEKAGFGNEDLIIRLKSFPRKLLQSIHLIDEDFLDRFDDEFPLLIKEIVHESHHTAMKELAN